MENKNTRWHIKIIRLILPIIIIGAGGAFAKHLYDTKPVANRIRPVIPPPLVETIPLEKISHSVVIKVMGKVTASQTISLKARVGGFITETSEEFIQGGIYKKGDIILKLDSNDFQLAVRQQEAALDKAEASLKLEMGKQEVAKAELRLMQHTSGRPVNDPELALRVPQLEQIKADIASIKVDLERARLNLERTMIKAPFNCMIMETNVETGSQISSQDTLATLSGIDEYHVEATVPVDQLKWIDFPANSIYATASKPATGATSKKNTAKGSSVVITTQDGATHYGDVIRLLGNLSDQSRLAQILIRIEDPISIKHDFRNPLLIDSYVQADIHGKILENVFAIPRGAVKDGVKIWLVENIRDNKSAKREKREQYSVDIEDEKEKYMNSVPVQKSILAIKNIDVVWKNSKSVFVKHGLIPGQKLVVSELASPVDGMVVKIHDITTKTDVETKLDNNTNPEYITNHKNTIKPESKKNRHNNSKDSGNGGN